MGKSKGSHEPWNRSYYYNADHCERASRRGRRGTLRGRGKDCPSGLARRGDLEMDGNPICPSIWSKLPCRGDLKEADTTSHSGSTRGFRSMGRVDFKHLPPNSLSLIAQWNDAEAIPLFSPTAFLRVLCVTTANLLLRRCAARATLKSSPVQPQTKDLR